MNRQVDALFVNPNSSEKIYQNLSGKFTAIEVPTWSLLLAQSCRSIGFGVAILDCDAERLTDEQASKRIKEINPRLVVFCVYGQNPNSGTTNMTGAISLCQDFKNNYPEYKTCFVGSHTSALPKEVLSYNCVDFVLLNEGVYALRNLLMTDLENDLQMVKGIGWKNNGDLRINDPQSVVPLEKMDKDLPGSAWDLLPYKEKPLDMYRSHFWHANFDYNKRTPAAAIYTSLGCFAKCQFCMINLINRETNDENYVAGDSNKMRFWSPEFIIREFDKLISMGVSQIRISDEMFFLNKKYYEPLLKLIVERGYGNILKMWCYSRADSVNPRFLDLFKSAGIEWAAIGVESGSQQVRQEVSKGSFKEINVRDVIKQIRDHGINVIANYIYGIGNETHETMQQTLDLALDLNTEMYNGYPAQALPGSYLYKLAKEKGWQLPTKFEEYSFHSYECLPMRTESLTAAEILKFRDEAWLKYMTNEKYLNLVESKFGNEAKNNILEMTKIKLKRKLLGD